MARTRKCLGCGRPDYPRCPDCGRVIYPKYLGKDLTPREWRKRRHLERATVYDHDLDVMTESQLKAFIETYNCGKGGLHEAARNLFPGSPIGVRQATRMMIGLAQCRLNAITHPKKSAFWMRRYELGYTRLPKFARWRSVYNPGHCALENPVKPIKKRKILDILAPEKSLDSKRKTD